MRDHGPRRPSAPRRLCELSPPPGAPAELWRLVRRARVRQALGESLARVLRNVRSRGGTVELELAGSGWEQALEARRDELRARLADALGAPVREIIIREGGTEPARPPAPAACSSVTQDDAPADRLRAVARRILASRSADRRRA